VIFFSIAHTSALRTPPLLAGRVSEAYMGRKRMVPLTQMYIFLFHHGIKAVQEDMTLPYLSGNRVKRRAYCLGGARSQKLSEDKCKAI
jgi:hypothetical protein